MALAHPEAADSIRRLFPRPPDRGSAASRAVLTRDVVAIQDVLVDPDYAFKGMAEVGFRSVLGVPLMREGAPIGAIAIGRSEAGPFPERQVALLQTFANQAVIAIENVRLFTELEARTAALSRSVDELRALGEVGRAVSSTLDLETVLRTIVARATELAGVDGGAIYEYEPSREAFRLHATYRLPEELVEALGNAPMPKGEGVIGRLALTGAPVAVANIAEQGAYQSRVRDLLLRLGYRSLLAVPLLREDRVLGGLVVNRRRAGQFTPGVIELLTAFATQSALAIHNARLFREIEDKSRQLEIASRHKSAFLANMSHELRTPLNAIIGFTRIVMRRAKGQIEHKQYENLDKILISAQHLLALINAILDLAKVESGKIDIRAGELRPAPLVEQCVRTIEPLLQDGVTLACDCPQTLPSMWTDEEKLRQIVINLLSNAAKFTASGSIRVSGRVLVGDRIEFAVADTGTGIAADHLDSIFEEFQQVGASAPREHAGTGLGLAIARRLARLMGGELRAESRLGVGSTFTLTLPIRYTGAPA
jgi:signal transduction histidine kinase